MGFHDHEATERNAGKHEQAHEVPATPAAPSAVLVVDHLDLRSLGSPVALAEAPRSALLTCPSRGPQRSAGRELTPARTSEATSFAAQRERFTGPIRENARPDYRRSMMNRRRTVAIVVVVAAALALGWTSSRVWGPAVFGSERPSVSMDRGFGTDDSAVVQRGSSLVRTFVGDRPSPSRDLLAALGLAAIAAAAFWTRRRTEHRSAHEPLRPLRGTVALRAPPSNRLF